MGTILLNRELSRGACGMRLMAGVVLALVLSACAGGGGMEDESKVSQQFALSEETLTKVGFEPVYAKTPAQYADLNKLPQHSVIFHSYQGRYRYLYVDTELCGCVYVGDRLDYQRYQAFLIQQHYTEVPYDAVDVSDTIPQGLNQWGPFYDSTN